MTENQVRGPGRSFLFDIDSTNEEILHLPWSCVVYALSPQREAVLHVEPSDTQSASLVLRNRPVLLIRSLIILFRRYFM